MTSIPTITVVPTTKISAGALPLAPDIAELWGFSPGTVKVCKPTKDDVKPPTEDCPWWRVTYRFQVGEEKATND